MGRVPIDISVDAVFAKMVTRKRGGYCFEHNTLLSTALQALGFAVTKREARVRYMLRNVLLPRTHGVLTVALEGKEWLCDVGFGGEGLIYPVDLSIIETEQPQHAWRFRIMEEGPLRVLQTWKPAQSAPADSDATATAATATAADGSWMDQLALLPGEVYAVDWEMASYFTSTHPDSIFRRIVAVQLAGITSRKILRGNSYIEITKDGETVKPVNSREECLELLRTHFTLDMPADTVLCAWPATAMAASQ
eukprot:m.57291 g.57291  ORF g.57291 m.57291 type:complete len:250 (+) comp13448_c0_seq5:273-1022(+)